MDEDYETFYYLTSQCGICPVSRQYGLMSSDSVYSHERSFGRLRKSQTFFFFICFRPKTWLGGSKRMTSNCQLSMTLMLSTLSAEKILVRP